MISLKKHTISYILLLTIIDVIIIILRIYDVYSLDILLWPQIIATFFHYNIGKSKLYDVIRNKRKEVLKKYNFMGKYSTWELNIIKAASDTQDELLKVIRNKVLMINLVSVLLIVNIICMFYILDYI